MGREDLATTTGDGCLNIIWVDLWLHVNYLLGRHWAYWVGNPVNQWGKSTSATVGGGNRLRLSDRGLLDLHEELHVALGALHLV